MHFMVLRSRYRTRNIFGVAKISNFCLGGGVLEIPDIFW